MRSSNKPINSITILLLLSSQLVHAQIKEKVTSPVKGKVINQLDEPVIDATVTNTRTGISVVTNTKGIFSFKVLTPNTLLKVYGVNIRPDSFFVRRARHILIRVEEKITPHVVSAANHDLSSMSMD